MLRNYFEYILWNWKLKIEVWIQNCINWCKGVDLEDVSNNESKSKKR